MISGVLRGRLLGVLPACGWEVSVDGEHWTLTWREPLPREEGGPLVQTMPVCSAEWSEFLAIDAALDFLDRYKTWMYDGFLSTREALMQWCAREASRQR